MANAPDKHALLSPSSAHRWMACPASVVLERLVPNRSSKYADEGTAAHELAAMTLQDRAHNCEAYLGRMLPTKEGAQQFEVDEEMCQYVQTYVDKILENAEGNTLLIEQPLSISHITGEPDAEGTGDAVIIYADGDWLEINDLKYGYRPVSANRNKQLMTYALGAVEKYEHLGPFKFIRVCIHQPRISSRPSEWECTIEELMEFKAEVEAAAQRVWSVQRTSKLAVAQGMDVLDTFGEDEVGPELNPGRDTCQWCNASGICPASGKKVRVDILAEMDDAFDAASQDDVKTVIEVEEITTAITTVRTADNARLARAMAAIEFVESWAKSVRGVVEAKLFAGEEVPGYKLVEGKQGNRAWLDKAEVETALKSMRLGDEKIYTSKIISPTQAEKLLAKSSPRRWKKLQTNITRSDGKPSVAHVSDERPALVIKSAMDDIEEAVDISDLA